MPRPGTTSSQPVVCFSRSRPFAPRYPDPISCSASAPRVSAASDPPLASSVDSPAPRPPTQRRRASTSSFLGVYIDPPSPAAGMRDPRSSKPSSSSAAGSTRGATAAQQKRSLSASAAYGPPPALPVLDLVEETSASSAAGSDVEVVQDGLAQPPTRQATSMPSAGPPRLKIVFKGGRAEPSSSATSTSNPAPLPTPAPTVSPPLPHPPSPSTPAYARATPSAPHTTSAGTPPAAGPSTSRKGGPKNGADGLNRVCHHHKSKGADRPRMTCINAPECKTIWCNVCVNKHYLACTPTAEFVAGEAFLCPVCQDACLCAGCKRKRKGLARGGAAGDARRGSTSGSASVAGSVAAAGSPRMEIDVEEEEEADQGQKKETAQDPKALKVTLKPPQKRQRQEMVVLGAGAGAGGNAWAAAGRWTPTATPFGGVGLGIGISALDGDEADDDESSDEEVVMRPSPPVPAPTPVALGPASTRRRQSLDKSSSRLPSTSTSAPSFATSAPFASFFASPSVSLPSSDPVPPAPSGRPRRIKRPSSAFEDYAVEITVSGRAGARGGRARPLTTLREEEPAARSANVVLATTHGKRRRPPRLSGLSSASSCSDLDLSSGIDDDDDDDALQPDADKVQHWMLVPPSEPQPVLAGLERNLSEGGGEGLTFGELFGGVIPQDDGAGERPRKPKVKWIEGPERRRRRALAAQKARDEAAAANRTGEEEIRLGGGRARSEGGGGSVSRFRSPVNATDLKVCSFIVDRPCDPIKPFGSGSSSPSRATSSPLDRRPSLPFASTAPPAAQYSDHPPSYESHFPPGSSSSMPPTCTASPFHPTLPPSILVSPASGPAPATTATHDLDPELASRSADDKRLGLRLLDAIRNTLTSSAARTLLGVTGGGSGGGGGVGGLAESAKAAMEAMGLSSSLTPPPAPPVGAANKAGPEQDASSPSLAMPMQLDLDLALAEAEAQRRDERRRLEDCVEPEKAFKPTARGDTPLLLAAGSSSQDQDQDQDQERRLGVGVGVGGMDVEDANKADEGAEGDGAAFDFDSFVATSAAIEDLWAPATTTTTHAAAAAATGSSSSSTPSAQTPASPTPDAGALPSRAISSSTSASSDLGGTTPVKALLRLPESDEYGDLLSGAATPTRGLAMELDLELDGPGGRGAWAGIDGGRAAEEDGFAF
ncbi:hypothetical protein JCM1841_006903 [Sporobolomyces salmonicolor]